MSLRAWNFVVPDAWSDLLVIDKLDELDHRLVRIIAFASGFVHADFQIDVLDFTGTSNETTADEFIAGLRSRIPTW